MRDPSVRDPVAPLGVTSGTQDHRIYFLKPCTYTYTYTYISPGILNQIYVLVLTFLSCYLWFLVSLQFKGTV